MAAALAVGLLAGSALIVWLGMWFRPPRPVAIVLIGAGYETNLAIAHNVYGWRSAERLAGIRAADGWDTVGQPTRLLVGAPWDRDLAAADAPTVLVYLALQGGADDRGAYLLPDDSDGQDTPDQRLRIEDVIDRLAQLPADRTKILLLDATQLEASSPLGMPRNEFARALAGLDRRIAAVPNLVVFASTGPDQKSWASPEYGETVFGLAVRAALSGNAIDRTGDGLLQLDEAFAGAAYRVESWAAQNRGALQTPVLLPAGDEGRRRAARVTLGKPSPVADSLPDPPSPDLPPDLTAAWADEAALKASQPAPYVYAPHLWRRYLDALLRFEELLLAGDRPHADRMRDVLRELSATILADGRLTLDAAQNALPMAAVAGVPTDPLADRTAEELWAAPPADAVTKWTQWPSQASGPLSATAAASAFRLAVMRRLFELEGSTPEPRPDRLIRLLRLVEDTSRPRPVESQFTLLLYRDLAPSPPPVDLIRHGVQVRLQAERAALGAEDRTTPYSYSERVTPFTRSLLDAADTIRLPAQDRLLATDQTNWTASRTGLDQAVAGYDKTSAGNADARRVLVARNRVAAELPFYDTWLSRVPQPDGTARWRSLDDAVRLCEGMWAEWHALGDEFARAETAADPVGAVRPLADRADRMLANLDRLTAEFDSRVNDLAAVDLPTIWRVAVAALKVPFLEPDVRRRLTVNLRRTSWMFLTQTRPGPSDPPSVKETSSQSDDNARRHGRLALATLGRNWFDHPAGGQAIPEWESYDVVKHRLTTFVADPDGWRVLLHAGTEIGRRFQRMPDDANDRLKRGDRSDLLAADDLARVVPPGPGTRLLGNPATGCRQFYLGELFVRLAKRTWTEHFFPLNRNDEPYYQRAGLLFLADVSGAAGTPAARTLFTTPGRLRVSVPPDPLGRPGSLALTSEPTAKVAGILEPEPGATVPPGEAVWEAVPGTGLELVGDTPAGGRRVAAVTAAQAPLDPVVRNTVLTQAEANPPPTPDPVPSRLTLRAWFRGQRIETVREVVIYPRPSVTVDQMAWPREASLAVRASPDVLRRFGTGTGAVAFVLDCSGSMGVPPGAEFTPEAKYAQATRALEQVLKVAPVGTRVSLRTFGEAVGPERTVATPEETIETLFPPTAWKPADSAQLEGLMARVRYPALIPWNESPILRAMASAKEDLKGDPGFKTIVVLTDGKDNRFEKDKKLNPNGLDFPALLDSVFRGTGITVHVVGFKVVPNELEAVRKQFAGLGKLDPPGSFVAAEHIDELTAALRRAFRQELRYWVETEDRLPVAGLDDNGIQVGSGLGGDRWLTPGMDPGGYRVRALSDYRTDTNVVLGPGDRLLLALTGDRDRLRFRRLLAADGLPGRPSRDQSGWRLSVPQLQRLGAGMQSLVWLEKTFDPAEQALQELRPRDAWFELSTAGDVAVTWRPVPGYPAPAWGFDSPQWPGPPSRPTLRAWWNPDQEATVAGRLDRGADFDTASAVTDRRLFVDDDAVVVRSVTVEDHVVDVAPGRRQTMKCLVVRVAHGPGNTVRVGVRGPAFEGSSQWMYPTAGESAAVFWPAESDRTLAQVQRVELVSLRAFKRLAEQRGFAVTMDDLPAPDPADERPRPPIPLP